MRLPIKLLILITLIWSCNATVDKKVKNTAVVDILNGMGKKDTVRYVCDSCEKYIKSQDVLNKIIAKASKNAKASLNNPLSFVPRSIEMIVSPGDSFYYYSTNKHVDSCLMIDIKYNCIGKNAYGTEGEVNSSILVFLVGDSIQENFLENIKKKPLGVRRDEDIVDRSLLLFDIDGEGNFTILPTLTKPYTLIITSSISCVDKDATLYFIFEDKTDLRLKNWNKFNCKGTAYFNLDKEAIEMFRTKKIQNISFYGDKQQFARVSKNETDYFLQFISLLGI